MAENLVLDPILACFGSKFGPLKTFLWVLSLLDVIHCCKLSLYVISRKTNETKLEKIAKNLVSGPILAHLPQFRAANFFSPKNWLCQSLDNIVNYHHVQYQKKIMFQSWKNLVLDGRTGRQRDRQTNKPTRMIS